MRSFPFRLCFGLAIASLGLVLASFALSFSDKALGATPTLSRTSSGKLFFDDFNRTLLGSGYTPEDLGTGGWAIVGNRLRYTSTSGNGQAYLRSASSYNGEAIYDFTFRNTDNSLVAPRFAMQKAAGPTGDHYLFDTDHGTGTVIFRIASGVYTTLLDQPLAYDVNVDYRTKIRVGAGGTGTVQVWRNEALLGTGDDTLPLGAGNFSFHVGNFDSGGTVDYDNMAIYQSTKLTVNGSYGSWALYQNDGTTPVGTCNTSSIVDYATVTSFPADYAAGSASQIKVFPTGITDCTGTPAAIYAGSPGNEIFGGDVFTFTP
jgi:hypothetical protein